MAGVVDSGPNIAAEIGAEVSREVGYDGSVGGDE